MTSEKRKWPKNWLRLIIDINIETSEIFLIKPDNPELERLVQRALHREIKRIKKWKK